jgi:transposase
MSKKPITLDPENLPDDLKLLKALVVDLIAELKNKQTDIDHLREQLIKAVHYRFGRRSETASEAQIALFEDLIKAELADIPKPEKPAEEKKIPVKAHGRRKPPKDLPKKTEYFPLAEDKKCCPDCHGVMRNIGTQIRTEIEWIPASVFTHEFVAEKFACPKCQNRVVTSELPAPVIKRGMAGPGLLAHVVTSKYDDSIPLGRLVRIFARHGFEVNDSTLNDWVGQVAYLFAPLMVLMRAEVLKSKVIHNDETPVAVQEPRPKKGEGGKSPGVHPITGEPLEKKAARQGRLWVYVGDARNPYDVFDYSPDRKGEHPREFLEGWSGYLQADAYSGLDKLYAKGGVKEVACWAHVRRGFKEAMPMDKTRAQTALGFISLLYETEKLAEIADAETRRTLRQKHSKPVLEKFKVWLDTQSVAVLPKSAMGEAIGYARNQWEALNLYLEDGDLHIDNNVAERALRRVAIGRKNWTTLGTDEGGRWAATFFSIVATCHRHGIDSYAYLRDVLGKISTHPTDRLCELLPPAWKAAQEMAAQEAAAKALQTGPEPVSAI